MNTRTMGNCILAAALGGLLAGAGATQAARFSGQESIRVAGVECHAHKVAEASGETHWCLFDTSHRGRRDFSSRNGRAGYVVSTLGPDCEEIEILEDVEAEGAAAGKPPWRRVSVACTD